MDNSLKNLNGKKHILKLLKYREVYSDSTKFVKQNCQFTDDLVKRLGLEYELEGHDGCVNCLQWSADGRHLASGSDDTKVIYWDPFHHKKLHVIPTPHIGNIFSVKFLGSDDSIIATGAGDCRVVVQNLEEAVARSTPLLQCGCHIGRVKRLATCPDQPMLFWSAGEDGLVIQYDMREPHECPMQSRIFIDLSFSSEVKCIAVNPTNPNYIAIGANDCYVRMYDRRKVKTSSVTINHTFELRKRALPTPQDPNCVQYYSPGHLAKENLNMISFKLAATYVAFNAAGTEMLVNMGGEQIYLFDVNNSRHINEIVIPQNLPHRRSNIYKPCCRKGEVVITVNNNETLEFSRDLCACDYIRRASFYMERNWMGDAYSAARDYMYVLQHCKDYKQAYIGLIKCLIHLKWAKEAANWFECFNEAFPESKAEIAELSVSVWNLGGNEIAKDKEDEKNDLIKRVDDDEKMLRENCLDYKRRFLGHCNTTTDIKEANFLGEAGNYICAGSDEGIIFVWDKKTSEIVTAILGDVSIVNCIQPHPSACFVASSGIDPAVKLWAPLKEDGVLNSRLVLNLQSVIEQNQERMSMDPFETMLANMGYHRLTTNPGDGPPFNDVVPSCRTS